MSCHAWGRDLSSKKNGRNCFALAEINMRADPSLGFVDP